MAAPCKIRDCREVDGSRQKTSSGRRCPRPSGVRGHRQQENHRRMSLIPPSMPSTRPAYVHESGRGLDAALALNRSAGSGHDCSIGPIRPGTTRTRRHVNCPGIFAMTTIRCLAAVAGLLVLACCTRVENTHLSSPGAAGFKMRVEIIEVPEPWHRHQEVPAAIADDPLDLALVVPLAGAAKAVLEQVMGS